MSNLSRLVIFLCFFFNWLIQILQLTTIVFSWVPNQVENGMESNQSVLILNGLAFGNFFGVFGLRFFQKFMSRRCIWLFCQLSYCGTFYCFATFSYKRVDSTMAEAVYGLSFFLLNFFSIPGRMIINSLTSKLFQKSTGAYLQMYGIARNIGTILAPLFVEIFLRFTDISTLFLVYTTLMLIPSLIVFIMFPSSSEEEKKGEAQVSYSQIAFSWNGMSILLNIFFGFVAFTIMNHSVAVFIGINTTRTPSKSLLS